MAKGIANESSVYRKRVRFGGYSTTGQRIPITPDTVRYRIYDVTNDRIVRDWTDLTAGPFVDIQVSATENAIYDDNRTRKNYSEERMIAVQANYGTDEQFSDEYRYIIRNKRGIDS